jgi:hypothetical protein
VASRYHTTMPLVCISAVTRSSPSLMSAAQNRRDLLAVAKAQQEYSND